MPPHSAPDFGPDAHTSTLDTTVFNNGDLFLRARFKGPNRPVTGPIIKVTVANASRLTDYASPSDSTCECVNMIVRQSKGTFSKISDPRRRPNGLVPLGPDDDYVDFAFEIVANLESGSDPNSCAEGQKVKRTDSTGYKGNCQGGNGICHCYTNTDCYPKICYHGTHNGEPCNEDYEAMACRAGGGQCIEVKKEGVCIAYAFLGDAYGDDDYKKALKYIPKIHDTNIVWMDAAGLPDTPHGNRTTPYNYKADFYSQVGNNCICHFQLMINWDGKQYQDPTELRLFEDGTSTNCEIN